MLEWGVLTQLVDCFFFFFNDTATTEIYTLSLHDALPIFLLSEYPEAGEKLKAELDAALGRRPPTLDDIPDLRYTRQVFRSEEHTSELQSRQYLVCRLLLEKKNKKSSNPIYSTSPCLCNKL